MQLKRAIILLVGVACVVAVGYFLYAHLHRASSPAPAVSLTPDTTPAPGFYAATSTQPLGIVSDAPRTPPEGTREYRSSPYNFSLFYPDNLAVKAYDEGGGATTITFQDPATSEGFQMFIVPYQQNKVSVGRFEQDEPSGVMQGPLDVQISGVPATSFYSSNAFLGDTAEIWFIRGGYLYETTAPKQDADWFSQIMQTWVFI